VLQSLQNCKVAKETIKLEHHHPKSWQDELAGHFILQEIPVLVFLSIARGYHGAS